MKFELSKSRVSQFSRQVAGHRICFLVGPPLIGKTRLLNQLRDSVYPETEVLSWERLGQVDISQHETIFLDLEASKPQGLYNFLREFKGRKILIATRYLPSLPIEIMSQIHIYQFENWTEQEIEEIIPSTLKSFSQQIIRESQGHPFITYQIIYDRLRGLNPSSPKTTYLEYLLSQIDPNNLDNLFILSKLKYFKTAAHELLENIDQSEIQWILKYRILISSPKLHLGDYGKQLIQALSEKQDQKALIEKCVSYLENFPESINAKKDLVWLYLESGEEAKSFSSFISCAKEVYLSGEFSDYVQLSDSFLYKLPIDLFLYRRESLAYLGRNEQALEETQSKIKHCHPSEKEALDFCQALCHFALSQTEKALELIDEILRSPQETEIYTRTLIAKSFFITPTNPDKALEFCMLAQNALHRHENSRSIQGEVSFQRGLIYDFLHQKSEAHFYYKDAQRAFSLERNKAKELLCMLNIANLEFDAGSTKQFLTLIDQIEKECIDLNLLYLRKACGLSRAVFLAARGKFVEAKRCIRRLTRNDDKTHQRRDHLLQRRLCFILFQEGKYSDARDLIGHLLTAHLQKNHQQDYLVLQSLGQIADIALLKNFHLIPKLAREILQSNMSPSNKMGCLICILEVNFRFYMPIHAKDLAGKIESLLLFGHEIDRIIHLKLLCGIYQLFNSDFKKAIRLLSEAELSSKEVSFDHLHFRSLLFLAACYIRQRKISVAISKLKEARSYTRSIVTDQDHDILNFLEGACYFLQPDLDQFNFFVHNLKNSPAKSGLSTLLESKNGDRLHTEGFHIQFYEHFQRILHLKRRNYYAVKTSESVQLVPVSSINNVSTHNADIVINEVSRRISIGKRNFSYSKKSLLIRLLRYLLQHSGRFISKEEICVKVWMENYNTIVHDQRIYTAIRRLRRLLRKPNLIMEEEGKYSISMHWKYLVISSEEDISLNDRQGWILSFIETHGSASRSTITKALQLSASSCKSDLNKLIHAQKIESFGSGKNTRYRRL